MTYDVGQAIDKWVAYLEEPREPDGLWHPSSMWGCTRKAIYEVRGTQKSDPIPAEMKRVFRIGHLLHEFIQDAVRADTDVIESYSEVPVTYDDYGITGHADHLIRTAEGWRLLEFKTINPNGFRYVADGPKDDHRWQALTYMWVLREAGAVMCYRGDGNVVDLAPLGDSLTRASVFYISKGAGMEHVQHDIEWHPENKEAILDRIHGLNDANAGLGLPDRLVAPKGKPRHPLCGYCQYETLCYSEE